MNDEDLFIFLTQILEKLESIDIQLKRLNYKQGQCESIPSVPEEPEYYPPIVYNEPPVVYNEPEYCSPEIYCESIYYYEPVYCEPYNPYIDYSYIYNPYYDYTLDYLVPLDEYCYDESYYC